MAVWAAHETEQLINLVRQNHTIYDPSSNDYRNRDVLKRLWNNIANEMNRAGRIFISDMDCRDRWNSLRDGYRRFVKDEQALPSGSKPKKKKTWHWSEAMSFLKPYIQERTSNASLTTFNSFEYKRHEGLKDQVVATVQLPIASTVVTNNGIMGKSSVVVSNVDGSSRVESSESSIIAKDCTRGDNAGICPASESRAKWQGMQVTSTSAELASSSPPVVISTPPQAQDPDEQFFRSLLPDVKVLTPRQRGIFKIQVQQLLQEMLYPKDSANRLPPQQVSAHQTVAAAPSHVNYGAYSGVYPSERWAVNIHGSTGDYNKPHSS